MLSSLSSKTKYFRAQKELVGLWFCYAHFRKQLGPGCVSLPTCVRSVLGSVQCIRGARNELGEEIPILSLPRPRDHSFPQISIFFSPLFYNCAVLPSWTRKLLLLDFLFQIIYFLASSPGVSQLVLQSQAEVFLSQDSLWHFPTCATWLLSLTASPTGYRLEWVKKMAEERVCSLCCTKEAKHTAQRYPILKIIHSD